MNHIEQTITKPILSWYDKHHRDLPWRVSPAERSRGVKPSPYRVWLSEIMLQQTTVQAVRPYFTSFLERWPDVAALAAAKNDDVMSAWAGLGYYSRARNLKKCAEIVVAHHDGRFPDDVIELKKLPGIGDYTAAAVATIAFDRHAAVVDGNIERVVSRLFRLTTPLPALKRDIKTRMSDLTPVERPGDFAQAMMDLGAMVCSPKRPACGVCPVRETCLSAGRDDAEAFPFKPPKKKRPVRRGAAFVAIGQDGAVLLRRRIESGLLGGMAEVPTTGWTASADGALGTEAAPFAGDWTLSGTVRHIFTHFELHLDVYRGNFPERPASDGSWWSPRGDLDNEALPTVMKKAIAIAIDPNRQTARPQKGTMI
ncbi:A/G-specific adenine glycosylase [Hoeflea prorocentri]|uniref:Adenine DNA glycosylase n=1 Tax=Hoeflea prorocentri TaxID=1922333 RepID=A0A9X3UJB4_9HYPH|nr:A/G-specific adenine glycosylase [Hoeflea prorocentri]MCY6381641.1 A/G-specific adenine glycosylase [Hoeflea prorocentri]MDA5399441.1 A/G-specific adenine glycosylase [Hoeflea prorocentri]